MQFGGGGLPRAAWQDGGGSFGADRADVRPLHREAYPPAAHRADRGAVPLPRFAGPRSAVALDHCRPFQLSAQSSAEAQFGEDNTMAPVAELTDRISDEFPESAAAIPAYLSNHYWWAYMRPWAVWIFDRQWVVNVLLYGHYAKLRDAAFAEFASNLSGRTLQISCCYGDLTPRMTSLVGEAHGRIDVVDIVPVQIENTQRKIGGAPHAHCHRMDAEALKFPDSSFDNVLLFFLLHEIPHESRERTIAEAFRVLEAGWHGGRDRFRRPEAVASASLSLVADSWHDRAVRQIFMARRALRSSRNAEPELEAQFLFRRTLSEAGQSRC